MVTENERPPLFDPRRHERLGETPWNEAAASAAIAAIAGEARQAFTPDSLWPIHPDDVEDGDLSPETSLYIGAAGVIWALDHLQREGAIAAGPSFADVLSIVRSRNLQAFENAKWRQLLGANWQTRSFLLGESGILLAQWKTGDPRALTALERVIAENTSDPALDLMWGAPGTMLAALAVYRATGIELWADLYRAGARALLAALHFDLEFEASFWTQHLYRRKGRYLGAVHGFAGNAFALIQGEDLLDATERTAATAHIANSLRRTAIHGDVGVNWAASLSEQVERRRLLVQHCHGAPGMITALSKLLAPIDDLLLAGGQLTWEAGPLAKGAGLCHGTAGNGYAFLKLFERTGDHVWLERARRFAMHALQQSRSRAEEVGRGRYSLWTGDLGLACFLWECINATARFPTMDVL